MFPYKYRRKTLSSKFSSDYKNVGERVKDQHEHIYGAIVQLVKEQQYETPKDYTKRDWKRVMIELQCTAYMKLKEVFASGNLPLDLFNDMQLEYLKTEHKTPVSQVDWHGLYLENCNKN